MATGRKKTSRQGKRVMMSNTASNMLASIFPSSKSKASAALETIKSDISDPARVAKLAGFEDVYVARGHGLRIVFKEEGDSAVITSVAAEG